MNLIVFNGALLMKDIAEQLAISEFNWFLGILEILGLNYHEIIGFYMFLHGNPDNMAYFWVPNNQFSTTSLIYEKDLISIFNSKFPVIGPECRQCLGLQ